MTARGWRRSSTRRCSGAASSSFRRSRSAASRNCSTGSALERSKRIPDAAGVRRQPDGGRRAAVLHRARATSSIPRSNPERAATSCAFCTDADDDRRIGAGVEGAGGVDATPAIVIAASGMATGGRVLHHLAPALPEPEQHGALRRLPGRRHARRVSCATAPSRSRFTARSCRSRADRAARLDVGARRRRRDHALAVGLLATAGDDLPRARRAGARSKRLRTQNRDRAAAGRCTSRSTSRRSNCRCLRAYARVRRAGRP